MAVAVQSACLLISQLPPSAFSHPHVAFLSISTPRSSAYAAGCRQVDLIVCYDATSSPTRSTQRMGRTGRHKEGRVVYILAAGREQDKYNQIEEASISSSIDSGSISSSISSRQQQCPAP